ncbi:ribonuclease H-like domain-containing protein [Tanacetum coccineum]
MAITKDSDDGTLVQILSLKSNVWEVFGHVNYSFHDSKPGILFNGALYWFCYNANDIKNVFIVSFDLAKEQFIEIPQPDDKRYVWSWHNQLGILNDNLCIFDQHNDGRPYRIWVMKSYNVKRSWKLLALSVQMKDREWYQSLERASDKEESLVTTTKLCFSKLIKEDARKTMLKQQFTEFSVTEEEGLHKGYDRFQKILSQLNQVQARPDNDDINLKYGVKSAAAPTILISFGRLPALDQSIRYSDSEEFEKKQAKRWNTTIKQPARFDRRKVRCYKCLQLGHFARECNVKTIDDKARYSAFKVEKVYGMMAGLHTDNGGDGNFCAAALSLLCWVFPRLYNDCYIKVQAYQNAVKTLESQKDWYHKTQMALEEKIRVLSANLENTTNTLTRFEKWKESSKNLNKLINSSMSTRTKIGLGFKEYFGEDEVFDLSRPSTMYPEPVEEGVKPLYSWFVKAGEMHAVPPSITGTYMPTPYKSDIEETQVSYGSKSDNKTSETLSESNDFVSCDNSDKSSDSETYASCDSSLKTKTKDFPPAVDIKTLPESDVEDPNSTAGSPSFSCLENVKSPRIFCNKSGMNNRNVCKNNSVRVKKCFVCGSKLHLIKDCDFYNCVESVPCKSKAATIPVGSRNSPASDNASGSNPAVSRNRPPVNSAGRPNPAGWSKRYSQHILCRLLHSNSCWFGLKDQHLFCWLDSFCWFGLNPR